MRRNMDIIRHILERLGKGEKIIFNDNKDTGGFSQEDFDYNCYLVWQAGLAEGTRCRGWAQESGAVDLWFLTWEGNDFLDLVADETRFKRTKEIADKSRSFSFEAFKKIAFRLEMKDIRETKNS